MKASDTGGQSGRGGFLAALKPLARRLLPERVRGRWREEAYYLANRRARKSAPAPGALPAGVRLCGLIDEPTGVGSAARLLAGGCVAAGVPLSVTALHSEEGTSIPVPEWEPYLAAPAARRVNLLVFNADCAGAFVNRLGAGALRGRYNIAHWSWELPAFPARWRRSYGYFDEIWTISEFCRRAIAEKSPLPVRVIPYGVSPRPDPALTRADFGLPEGRVLYLCMFDARSIRARKNPDAAAAAYCRAFPADDGATALVVKGGDGAEAEAELAALRQRLGARRDVYYLRGAFSRPRVDALLSCCDVFVSLHRAEGFGLPIAEAMALGKCAVVTGWSGNMDFCSPDTACCVPYTLRPVGALAAPPYDAWQLWAEPDEAAAAQALRRLAADEPFRRALGERARAFIHAHYSPAACGAAIRQRLEELGKI